MKQYLKNISAMKTLPKRQRDILKKDKTEVLFYITIYQENLLLCFHFATVL